MLKIPSVEDRGCFLQQPVTPTEAEKKAAETVWFVPALSHTSGAQSFPGTMLLDAVQTPLFAQIHLLFIN